MSIKPWEGDGGEECDPDTDDVGQVEVGVIIVSLCQGVGHHSEIVAIVFSSSSWCSININDGDKFLETNLVCICYYDVTSLSQILTYNNHYQQYPSLQPCSSVLKVQKINSKSFL